MNLSHIMKYGREIAGEILPPSIKTQIPTSLANATEPGPVELGRILAGRFDYSPEAFEAAVQDGQEHYADIQQQLATELGEEYWEQYQRGAGLMPQREAVLLYALVRVIEPETVVETGVAQGSSSALILKALEENNCGTLDSIDLPRYADKSEYTYRDGDFPIEGFSGAVIPEGKEPGWLVDDHNKDRWTLHIGRSTEHLPEVVDGRDVDMFIHDSEHSYKNVLWELSITAPTMRPGGWMWVDDATWNSAASDFASGISWPTFSAGRAKLLHVTEDFESTIARE